MFAVGFNNFITIFKTQLQAAHDSSVSKTVISVINSGKSTGKTN